MGARSRVKALVTQIALAVIAVLGGAALLALTRTRWLQERLRRQYPGDREQAARRIRGARLVAALVAVYGLFRVYLLLSRPRP